MDAMGATFRPRGIVGAVIARNVSARGDQAESVAKQLGEKLVAPDLELVVVFADWRLDPPELVRALQRVLGGVPFVGCTAIGVVGAADLDGPMTVALGLYGEGVRAGIGVATELSKHALARSRDGFDRAAQALGYRCEQLDATRHVAFTLAEGSAGVEEAFCIGSAAAAPQIRVVGGAASTELDETGAAPIGPTAVWAHGEVMTDTGIAILLELARPFEAITSCHLVPTEAKTVVTAASGRTIEELDGVPAPRRLAELLGGLEVELDPNKPTAYSFARVIDGVPYVRSIRAVEQDRIQLASGVEPGHVLRIMKPGDLIALTRRDLAAAKERLGSIETVLAFSCVHRHWEAKRRSIASELAEVYGDYPTTGFQTFGEQTGMLFVNHTLTALAIGGG
jgi:hypothetical protein